MGSSKKSTVGHKYSMGQHCDLVHGPIDYISRISFDTDREAWFGKSAGGTITVSAESLFGGDDGRGGVAGDIDIMMGYPDQQKNSYLMSQLGNLIPAFRGVVTAVFKQFYFGNSEFLAPVSFRATRIHVRDDDGKAQWYPEKAAIPSYVMSGEFNNFSRPWKGRVEAWNSSSDYSAPDYDDTGWVSMNLPIGDQPNEDAASSGFRGSPATEVGTQSSVWLRRWIYVPEPISSFDFEAYIDNGAEVYVNGVQVVSTYGSFGFPFSQSIPGSHFQVGYNQLSIRVVDDEENNEEVDKFYFDMNVPLGLGIVDVDVVGYDMNPAHILRETDNSQIFGLSLPDADIDDAAFALAADRLYEERMGISLLWDSEAMTLEDFQAEICRHIDANHYIDNRTGLATLKLIRDDYDIDELPVLDATNVIRVERAASTPVSELVNAVTGVYWDPVTGKDASVQVSDPALVQMQGRIKSTTIQYPGFTNANITTRKIMGDLRELSNSLFSCTVIVNRMPEELNNGDPFKFNWPELNQNNTVMRIVDIDWGDGRNNDIRITCTQDVFALPDTPVMATSPDAAWEDPRKPPLPSPARAAFELPYYDLVQSQGQAAVDATLGISPELGMLGVCGIRPSGNAINARIAVDAGGGYVEAELMDFCPSFVLTDDIDQMTTSITFDDPVDLDELTLGAWAVLGSELCTVTDIDTNASTATLKRAVLDTAPVEHAAGTRLFFAQDYTAGDAVEYVDGEDVSVRIMPITSGGQLALSGAPTDSVSMASRAIRPYPPADVKINGEYFPTEVTGDAVVTWAWRNRLQQTGGTLLGFTDAGVTPEDGMTVSVEVFDADTDGLIHSQAGVSLTELTVPAEDLVSNNRLELFTVRDDIESWQRVVMTFTAGEPPPVLASLLPHLQSWWDLNEAGGTVTYDKHQTRDLTRSGTLVNWQTPANSHLGQSSLALSSTASASTYASAGAMLDYTNSSFVIWGWVRADANPASDSAWQHVWGRYAPVAGRRQYALRVLPNFRLSWFLRDTSETVIDIQTDINVLTINTWAFVATVFDVDAQEARIYVNGVLEATGALTGVALQSGGASTAFRLFNLDAAATTNAFIGAIDALGAASFVPDDEQMVALYNAGVGMSYEQLLHAAGNDGYRTDGVWTWFNDPRAIALTDGVAVGALTKDGAPTAVLFPTAGEPDHEWRLHPNFQVDDHNNPAFLKRSSDGRVIAAYSAHPGGLRIAVSTVADSVAEFGTPVEINTSISVGSPGLSYANPYELTGEIDSPIYLFTRFGNSSGTWKQMMTKSTDQGATWSTAVDFLTTSGDRPYLKIVQNGNDRLDFLVTDGHPSSYATNSVYHFYYQDGSYYQTDGTVISASLPFTPATHLTKVYDGATVRAWIWDIQIDGSGHPVILYSRFPTTSDHRYHRARWNGSAWEHSEICAAGGYLYLAEAYYSGGMCLDPEDVNVVYASREISGVHQIYRYETADGVTWTGSELINSANRKFRPFVPAGARALLYVEGVYTTYTNFRTTIRKLDL